MKTKTSNLIIFFSLMWTMVSAQDKTFYTADLKNDTISGLKRIMLTPKLRSVASDDFRDLRIKGEDHKQRPYFLQDRNNEFVESDFTDIDCQIKYKKLHTEVVVSNPAKKIYNSFTFKIANADVRKACTIEGSDSDKKWFVISDKINLDLYQSTTSGYNYYHIHFPSIDYRFIRVMIADSLSSPIKIKEVGYFKTKKSANVPKYQKLDYSYNIEQKDSITRIKVSAKRAFEINKIIFNIHKPELFSRNASIYYLEGQRKRFLKKFQVSSKFKNIFDGLSIKQKEFVIEIMNNDNEALSIWNIDFFQEEKFIIADLKRNQKYNITAGDKALKMPSYDLVQFKNEIKYNLPTLKISNEKIETKAQVTEEKEVAFYEKPWFMWVVIGFIGLLLLMFTISLMKKANEK